MAGLAQYSEYFQNPLFTEAIREVPVRTGYIGQRFLPLTETYDVDWNETVVTRQQDMADIVDNGAELPLTDRDPVKRVSGEIADIGQSFVVTKKELMALADRGNPGKRKIAEKLLLNKSATMKQNIDARIEWMRWQALGAGQLVYSKGGILLNVDFGVPASNKQTPTTKWDGVSPTILADYEAWVQAYIDLNGEAPDVGITSMKVIRTMLNDIGVRKAITGYSEKLLTLAEINSFLASRNMPPVEAFDANVTYRDLNNGSRTTQRLMSDKKLVFLKEGSTIGQQMLGPTLENDMNPGIFAHTISMVKPTREIIDVVAASFPKVTGPEYIYICTVLT